MTANEQDAWSTIVHEVGRVVGRRAWVVEVDDHSLRVLSHGRGEAGGLQVDQVLESPILGRSLSTDREVVAVDGWIALKLSEGRRRIALIAERAGSTDAATFAPLATWLPSVLVAVGERSRHARAEQQLLDHYKLARRAGRGRPVDAIARQLVQQTARVVEADRVAVAIYVPDERQLALAATHGYAIGPLRDRRIAPGEWVMGHVYASRRAVVVGDVRRLRPASDGARRYKTFSFAAVPLLVGGKVLGVLAATDKRDGGPFSRHDLVTLRALAGISGLGLAVTRSDAEASRLARAATVDALTGLFNRRYFDVRLRQELERGRRANLPASLLIIDIDDFKAINDTHGHPIGDVVLKVVARLVAGALRVFDVCARIGGDEIAVVMPTGDPDSVYACAERIRSRIATSATQDARLGGVARVTVSIGVTTAEADDTPERLLRRADEALYTAKHAGKNCLRLLRRVRLPAPSGERT
ncbi:MAG TPA: sensor domain-containing diguanylate cyclase [Vicinamibacterales bacterium]|nr:sensor domain-containing diguanylate cyclase [Vicinamibacterales bacterium]